MGVIVLSTNAAKTRHGHLKMGTLGGQGIMCCSSSLQGQKGLATKTMPGALEFVRVGLNSPRTRDSRHHTGRALYCAIGLDGQHQGRERSTVLRKELLDHMSKGTCQIRESPPREIQARKLEKLVDVRASQRARGRSPLPVGTYSCCCDSHSPGRSNHHNSGPLVRTETKVPGRQDRVQSRVRSEHRIEGNGTCDHMERVQRAEA